ncbi:MAG: Inner membrane protein YphA [Chlamydiae bacterium]|nr:Inner membrane protein YphA [Chlamydiota bacterium]
MNALQKLICFLGRICFSAIFIVAGINKIMNWDASEQLLVNQMLDVLSKSYHHGWAQTLLDQLMPLAPILLVIATIAELGGGLLVLLGIQVRFGAFILCLFLIPTTFFFHNFWALEGSEQQLQMVMFLKNLSIFGGALILLAFGKGPKRAKAE